MARDEGIYFNIKPITQEQAETLAKAIELPDYPAKFLVEYWKAKGLVEKPKSAMDELGNFITNTVSTYDDMEGIGKIDYDLAMEKFNVIKKLFDKVKEEINNRR